MIENGVVKKPWGIEYICHQNAEIAIWVLEIKRGAATSLHCHPQKNTALIVLRGEVELSFIRGAPKRFTGLDKINIFRGRFHRTRALTDDVVLLEIEAPNDKQNIIRLKDDYGRIENSLEKATEPLDNSCFQLNPNPQELYQWFAGCALSVLDSIQKVNTVGNLFDCGGVIYTTLSGGFENGLVPPGDAIDGFTLAQFSREFAFLPNTTFLQIWRAQ